MVSELSCQRGVGCTQVVKPPLVILYFFGPIFSIVSPWKYTSVSWFDTVGSAIAPGRGTSGLMLAKPTAL